MLPNTEMWMVKKQGSKVEAWITAMPNARWDFPLLNINLLHVRACQMVHIHTHPSSKYFNLFLISFIVVTKQITAARDKIMNM